MAFMIPEYEKSTFYEVESTTGEGSLVPGELVGKNPDLEDFSDYIEGGDPESFEAVSGWFARLSAPGYMDATDWSGPFDSIEEARKHIEDTFEVDPKSGEPLFKKASNPDKETRQLKSRLLK